jgi:hypothetical protein
MFAKFVLSVIVLSTAISVGFIMLLVSNPNPQGLPPGPVFAIVNGLVGGLQSLRFSLLPAPIRLFDINEGFFRSQALYAATKLRVSLSCFCCGFSFR